MRHALLVLLSSLLVAPIGARGEETPYPRLESALARLAAATREGGARAGARFAARRAIAIDGGLVAVTLRPAPGGAAASIDTAGLASLGGRIAARARHSLRALVPVESLGPVSMLAGVASVRRPLRGVELHTSEGVAAAGADAWQSGGVDGSGVRVAVIDNGFIGWGSAMGHGDLPASVAAHTIDLTGLGLATETEHGTAVAEAVYDMAPGAEIYLVKIYDETTLENALDTCVARGIDIVNHSVGWFGEPGDGTGTIAALAESARASGILWVNAAGNHAWAHNEGTFHDGDGDSLHEYSGTNESIPLYASAGDAIRLHLTWDGWPATNEDYDLQLTNTIGTVVDESNNRQASAAQEPWEYIGYTAPTSGIYYVRIKKYATSSDHPFDLFTMDHTFQTFRVPAGSLLAPADSPGAFAVGAINQHDYETGPQEYFSSQGPTNDGRIKPEIAGPDNCDSYTYGHWYGTSLASPHVAGAAALLLAAHPAWNTDSLWNGLVASTIDMGPAGPDTVYGYGRLDLGDLPLGPVSSFQAIAGDTTITLSWTNPADGGFTSTMIRYATTGFPSDTADGTELGSYPGSPGSAGGASHTGLTNGTVYSYTAFATNGVYYAAGTHASATPADTTAPAAPTFAAVKGDTSNVLSWTAPSDADVAGIVIVYSTDSFPALPGDGTPVENGAGGTYSAVPSAAGSDLHTGLANGTAYYYAAFAYDEVPNYSARAIASATPEDTLAPDTLAAFSARAADGAVELAWTSPSTGDLAGVAIRFSSAGYPSGPADAEPVPNGAAGLFPGAPGGNGSFTHSGLANDTTYYYAAFGYDEIPLYADAATAAATPGDTTAPAAPPSFTATAGDRSVLLAWESPSDSDFSFLRVRYDIMGYPAAPESGLALPGGAGGDFAGPPGAESTFTQTALANGTAYYYTAFAFDESGNHSGAVTAAATPADTAAPSPPSPFTVTPGDGSNRIAWTNPPDGDFAYTRIRYAIGSSPAGPGDGTAVENGAGGDFYGAPGSDSVFLHDGLTNGVTYRYAAFAYDGDGNVSAAAAGEGAPADTTPPGPVLHFSASPSGGDVLLAWRSPPDTDLVSVAVRYGTGHFPASPGEGTAVTDTGEGRFVAAPGDSVSYLHGGLAGGATYYYAAFALDGDSNASVAAVDSASLPDTTARDETPPGLALGIFPNPYLAAHLDLFLVATEPLDPDSLALRAGGEAVAMARTDSIEEVWLGKKKLEGSGIDTIFASAADLSGNRAEIWGEIAFATLPASGPVDLASPDRLLSFHARGGGAPPGGAIVILPIAGERREGAPSFVAPASGGGESARPGRYAIRAAGPWPAAGAAVAIRYGAGSWSGIAPEEIVIVHSIDGPLATRVDPSAREASAPIARGGTIRLARDRSGPSDVIRVATLRLEPNRPNPFNPATRIRFATDGAGRVRLSILGLGGRRVRSLFVGEAAPGVHEVAWDGRDDRGRPVASGSYIYRLETERGALSGKMLLLR